MFRLCFCFVIGNEIILDIALDLSILCLTSVFFAAFSLGSYACACPELETAHEQAAITALIQNISLERQGLEQRKVLKRDSFHNVHFFQKVQCILLQNYFCGCKAVSREAVVVMVVTEFQNLFLFSYQ